MSITLATTDTITGVAGSATAITYTIFGDEVAGGTDAFKVLAQGQLPSSVGTLYTVPASTATIVKQIHLVNGTVGSVTARLNVKGTAAANAILPAITILAGGFAIFADDGWNVYNDQGQKLGVGATGATGAAGSDGADGVGVPVGGATGEVLAKASATDFDTEWVAGGGGGVTVEDEGTPLATTATSLDFVGAGVTASGTGATKTITIPGGGGGATIQYPGLKPATPLDDFDGASLDGAWSVHSSGGTFTTGSALTQAVDGSHLSIGYHGQMGALIRATTNVDQEWMCGGMFMHGGAGSGEAVMPGIAILDTSGDGVGMVVYNASFVYLATITNWNYVTNPGQLGPGFGHNQMYGSHRYWLRLTRVGNTWDGYLSIDGRAWTVQSPSTTSRTIVAAHRAVGLFFNTAALYNGQLFYEWVHNA